MLNDMSRHIGLLCILVFAFNIHQQKTIEQFAMSGIIMWLIKRLFFALRIKSLIWKAKSFSLSRFLSMCVWMCGKVCKKSNKRISKKVRQSYGSTTGVGEYLLVIYFMFIGSHKNHVDLQRKVSAKKFAVIGWLYYDDDDVNCRIKVSHQIKRMSSPITRSESGKLVKNFTFQVQRKGGVGVYRQGGKCLFRYN